MKYIHNSPSSPIARRRRATDPARVGLALERLIEIGILLTEAMERGLAERGLSRPRAELLWRLHHQPAMTQRELSQALRCTPRNVTDLVDALEGSDLVARGPHPNDRRATLVTLTERGRAEAQRMQAGYQQLAESLFGQTSGAELETFLDVLENCLALLRGAPPRRSG